MRAVCRLLLQFIGERFEFQMDTSMGENVYKNEFFFQRTAAPF